MNNSEHQTGSTGTKSGKDYCTTSFEVEGQMLQNAYLCGQQPFTASNLWNIQKQRRQFVRRF